MLKQRKRKFCVLLSVTWKISILTQRYLFDENKKKLILSFFSETKKIYMQGEKNAAK